MNDSEIFIVGANGQLGTALRQHYPKARYADVGELDITNQSSVDKFDWTGIKVIINAAAYTNVDGAESPEGEKIAEQVNAEAVGHLAKVAIDHDMTLVHISTDYVFDGSKSPHKENEPFNPLNAYGRSKVGGDKQAAKVPKHYILRTSWVIGEGKNFVRTMLDLGKKGVNPSVVDDQTGRLTFTHTLVDAADFLLKNSCEFGTYNVSNDGPVKSWADITQMIFKYANLSNEVTGVSTKEYYKEKPEAATRPLKSELDLSKIKAAGFSPADWTQDLEKYVNKEMAK